MKPAILNRLAFQALLVIALLGASLSTAISATRDEVVLYLNNAQGSAVAAFDENANVCWEETFTPYGRKQVLEDSFQRTGCGTVAEERGFTGHVEDNEIDLVYMQQRYYDPTSGRFLSMDPVGPIVGDPASLNRYSYAKNNPYKYTDPDGRLPMLLVWGYLAIEAALTVSDVVDTAQTMADPNATTGEKAMAGGLLAMGAVLPGAGYTKADNVLNSVRKAEGVPNNTAVGRRHSPGATGPDAPQSGSGAGRHNPQPPTVVENAIQAGQRSAGSTSSTSVFTDTANNVRVVVNSAGRIVTVE